MQPSLLDAVIPAASPLSELLKGDSRCARLAQLFTAKRGQWIDGREIAQVAGAYAWRTRISDLRHSPWLLTIENRVRTVEQDGETFKVSEYKLT